MIGAIAGDIIGSVYERYQIKTKDFPLFHPRCRFTDDTVLTVAVADAILTGRPYEQSVREIGRRYPSHLLFRRFLPGNRARGDHCLSGFHVIRGRSAQLHLTWWGQ